MAKTDETKPSPTTVLVVDPPKGGNDEVAKLKAQLAEAQATIASHEKAFDQHAAALDRAEDERDQARRLTEALAKQVAAGKPAGETVAANATKRAALKADTVKEGGNALYLIPEDGQMYYRLGATYKPGSIVRIPVDEEPSITWLAVEAVPGPSSIVATTPALAAGSVRASDKEI